jgi:formylglycine-generating enzyme required for sulfatase activity
MIHTAAQRSPSVTPKCCALTDSLAAHCPPRTKRSVDAGRQPDQVAPTHTTWFFETFVLPRAETGYLPFHPDFGYLFNSYYEAVGARHPRAERGLLSRPGIAEIADYREHVDDAMLAAIATMPPDLLDLVELGLHHEQQHQELLIMDIKHVLSTNPLRPAYRSRLIAAAGVDRVQGWTEHEGGLVEIGHDGNGFAFDNEAPRHHEYLEPYALADRPVSCGDWLAFMADDGYHRADIWLSDGWATVQQQSWEAPQDWEPAEDGWQVFTLARMKLIDPSEPVCHLSYYEADVRAHWSGAPADRGRVGARGRGLARDGSLPRPRRAAPRRGTGPSRCSVTCGSGRALRISRTPLPPGGGAVGEYNGKFMVNQHVLRGGCCATPTGHCARRTGTSSAGCSLGLQWCPARAT